ncbi:uncharacterized protein K452DRAFT_362486 [Aplosporella prunicola CBS 121167]|uniref:Beta-lactamase-related domain-containing protein n=1 Tax=Aplosporella prunicola CBS 121167 TaxID=1176127 RepID=A0A6A6AZV2_9PEZI|nr:uncharacterized protein K452DRAFT_362486 [Aplosporella prunicola CBS 121167]KAF2136495.1 hypothetical protein K452DRAFT_362486 [Aplosporella prunicola CBS 121167]
MSKIGAPFQQKVEASLDQLTTEHGIPGAVFMAVDRRGAVLASHSSGTIGKNQSTPMSADDTVFWIASCTKLITGIACMQLVEQGKISLDDADALYAVLPELRAKKVLAQDGKTLVDKEREITLLMLLNHTAGFGYSFFNKRLNEYARPVGLDEFSGDARDVLDAPLVNQPGERWEYGTSIDWAGLAVERLSGQNLDAYFTQHIFQPLGIENIRFFPTDTMRRNLAYLHQATPDGAIHERDHLLRRSVSASTAGERAQVMCAGGAGCFASAAEYAQVLAAVLNDGVSGKTGARILAAETVARMFGNTLPEWPDFGRVPTETQKPDLSSSFAEQYAQAGSPPQGWGITFLLSNLDGKGHAWRGRCAGNWSGVSNVYYWLDREKGVAGVTAAQVLPFGNAAVQGAAERCERAVYAGLGLGGAVVEGAE